MKHKVVPGIILALVMVGLWLTGCSGGVDQIQLEDVVVVEAFAKEYDVKDYQEKIEELVYCINEARHISRSRSGRPTHRLVLMLSDGRQYTFNRVNEELVEVGLRHEDIRQKYFLESAALADIIKHWSN